MSTSKKGVAIVAAAVAAVAILGTGAFQIGRSIGLSHAIPNFAEPTVAQTVVTPPSPNADVSSSKIVTRTSAVTNEPQSAPAAAPVNEPVREAAAPPPLPTFGASAPARTSVTSPAPITTAVQPAPATVAEVPPTAAAPTLAMAPVPPVVASEQTVTTVQTKRSYSRPVYTSQVTRRRRHHSSGKVHVARAAKHTASFVAKLPGRLHL